MAGRETGRGLQEGQEGNGVGSVTAEKEGTMPGVPVMVEMPPPPAPLEDRLFSENNSEEGERRAWPRSGGPPQQGLPCATAAAAAAAALFSSQGAPLLEGERKQPSLLGDCLEVAAIKALAAPEDPLPVRFFAALAAAVAPSPFVLADDDDMAVGKQGCGGSRVGGDLVVDVEAEMAAAAGTISVEGVGGCAEGDVLAGVLEMVRRTMCGQMRLTEALLTQEVSDGWL